MPESPDLDSALVCWDCGTPLVMSADGAEKPCGHTGTMVLSRAEYRRRKGPRMPESPDFDQIARQIVHTVQMAIEGAGRHPEPIIAEQLRLVWNARGTADVEALKRSGVGDTSMQGTIYQDLKALDR